MVKWKIPANPMLAGRINKVLDKRYSFDDGIRTLRQEIERSGYAVKREISGESYCFNRTAYNRMDGYEQDRYMAKLREKRVYFINDVEVPKLVYDAVEGD